jgi:TM2 domain-containing membrane protein YozV
LTFPVSYSHKVTIVIAAFFCFVFLPVSVKAENDIDTFHVAVNETVYVAAVIENADAVSRPNPVVRLFKTKQKKNKKITAAILAFPFPFGIVGLHRIYLGTAPHVPVVYIGTLGGVLGILPFIDFCVLVLDKNIDRFIENKKVLMWVDENKKAAK